MRLGRLPSSLRLFLTSLALTSSALPFKTEQVLTVDTFKTSIAQGVWFIEHFSPYCGHCKHFAPTWEELVTISEADVPGINLAQVNCAVNGDLCNANGIKGYPTLSIYKDGAFMEDYKDNRDLDKLVAYIKQHALAPPPAALIYTPNMEGIVQVLDDDSFNPALSLGPTFVKFYAPWCGHCKKLAPTWVNMAKLFRGKLAITEVDCDAHKALCSAQGVEGFPTLVYYSAGGVKTEYSGGRKLEQLAAFADKANAPAAKAVGAQDLESYITENDIVYVLIHTTAENLAPFTPLFASLLGTPPVYTVSDAPATLLSRYGITGNWALLSFKDHDTSPTSILKPASVAFDKDQILSWLLANRLPTTTELTQDTFQSVMKSPAKPLVVIGAVMAENKESTQQRFVELNAAWRKQGQHEREVVFTWMDLERWKDWMKSMYGVTKSGSVVVADHSALVYWNVDASGKPINVLDEKSVFSALDGAIKGSIAYVHSENIMERIARVMSAKVAVFERYVVKHPVQSVVGILGFVAVIVLAMRRWIMSDLPDEKYYRDKGRLD